jgi:hypothetical protein
MHANHDGGGQAVTVTTKVTCMVYTEAGEASPIIIYSYTWAVKTIYMDINLFSSMDPPPQGNGHGQNMRYPRVLGGTRAIHHRAPWFNGLAGQHHHRDQICTTSAWPGDVNMSSTMVAIAYQIDGHDNECFGGVVHYPHDVASFGVRTCMSRYMRITRQPLRRRHGASARH